MMDISTSAEAVCTDGPCGRSTCLIVEPGTETVTHVVVKDNRSRRQEFLVPFQTIAGATADSIDLRCSVEELHSCEPFLVAEWVRVDVSEYVGHPQTELLPLDHESVPQGEVALHPGARVEATDGRVGRVDGFLVNLEDGQITHLVMRDRHLWAPREVAIPVTQIDHVAPDGVYLKLDRHAIGALPAARSQ